ncbi:MAG: MBL fold metallo-hydrolase [Treponemataceae bacterium]|nr:MBL fold metallo-hydrolase [Treponemataceae bacterium]
MRITALIENTPGVEGCLPLHGLSFFIETERHKILFDFGPSDETLRNAEKLGIDLGQVDVAVLSHGHYDHSGGLLAFAALNPAAKIYMQRGAGGENYAFDGPDKGYRYIGIDKRILQLPQVQLLDGDFRIDEELSLFTVETRPYPLPSTNRRILKKVCQAPTAPVAETSPTGVAETASGSQGTASVAGLAPCSSGDAAPCTYIQDDFSHEHCLFVSCDDGSQALISGCAHNGILNIMEEFSRKFGRDKLPQLVVSGFHLMKKSGYQESDFTEQRDIARKLASYPCKFYTCHCTGEEPYSQMKLVLGDKLDYIHTGNIIKI